MKMQWILTSANLAMALTALCFGVSVYIAYSLESALPIAIATSLHVSHIVLAGLFKVAYVIRLVAQQQMGFTLR